MFGSAPSGTSSGWCERDRQTLAARIERRIAIIGPGYVGLSPIKIELHRGSPLSPWGTLSASSSCWRYSFTRHSSENPFRQGVCLLGPGLGEAFIFRGLQECQGTGFVEFPPVFLQSIGSTRMKRAVSQMPQKIYDVAIIGGGIYGASVARDAALRGLTVALVDQGDFGNATSANNHKIIHGGLRYLQHVDLKRMRESIRERSILMRIAPHLVHPLPFLIPTYRYLLPGKLIMAAALKLNDLISYDRNRDLEDQKMIPRSRIISRQDCLRLCPGLDQKDLTGGALFFDGQVHNPDRLTLSVLVSAARAGADLANYAQVTGFLCEGDTITGIQVTDVLSGISIKVRARIVVNCSGPWMNRVHELLGNQRVQRRIRLLKTVVIATRMLVQKVAVGVPSRSRYKDEDAIVRKGHRYFFITPWRNTSLIGTFQAAYDGEPDDFRVSEQDICGLINEINAAYPAAAIKREDVYYVYAGMVPRGEAGSTTDDVQYAKHYRIQNHEYEDGIGGLISVIGVKYTTARDVAQKTVDLVLRKLGRGPVVCQTATTPVPGGAIERLEEFVARELEKGSPRVSPETLGHLIQTYGSEYREILRYSEENQEWGQPVTISSPVTRAEVLHGIREEMAQKLSDVIFRRTELGTTGYPGDSCLNTCATIMAAELRWDEKRKRKELEETSAVYANRGCGPWTSGKTVSAFS